MSWRTEFAADTFAVPKDLEISLLAKGFSDSSWHNDVCPSFRKKTTGGEYVVWCDAINPQDREMDSPTRFGFCFEPSGDGDYKVIHESDSTQDLLIAVDEENQKEKVSMNSQSFLDVLKQVVNRLRLAGFNANVEYPGYIAIGERSYGTANGNWGWNDNDGNGGESNISGESLDVNAITIFIQDVERGNADAISDEAYLEAVGDHLKKEFSDCADSLAVIHTGGGIFCLDIAITDRVQLRFGLSDEVWGADVYVDGEFIDGASISTPYAVDKAFPKNAGNNLYRVMEIWKRDSMKAVVDKVDVDDKRRAAERGFQEALNQFRDSAIFLNRMWQSLPPDSKFIDMAAEKYPFQHSFDEETHAIMDWTFNLTTERV